MASRSIIVEGLTKNFAVTLRKPGITGTISSIFSPQKKIVEALRGISFSLSEGELVGFIGPNGAGKTTTLKILSGILYPTDGFTQVLGYSPWERKSGFLRQIALVMGQKNQLWWDLPAQETFALNKAIYEVSDANYRKTVGELTRLLDVEDLLGTAVRRLSLGQRMKLELIAALLHSPKVVFLDEPTIGLDVVAQQKLRDFIKDYNRRFGNTIILTSHNMDDVVNLAKRVIVIDDGAILFDGDLKELVGKYAKEKIIKIYLSKDIDYRKIGKIGRVLNINLPEVVISVPRETAAVAAAELLQSFPVDDLTIEEEPVEDIIRKVFGGK